MELRKNSFIAALHLRQRESCLVTKSADRTVTMASFLVCEKMSFAARFGISNLR
jgi:hypothetical protein